MIQKNFKWLGLALVLLCSLFLVSACSSNSSDSVKEDAKEVTEDTDKAVASADDALKSTMDKFKDDYNKLETEAASASGEDAAALKSIADHDLTDLEDLEKHLDEDIKDGKITQDVGDTAKKDIDSLKTSFKDISSKLETAAAGATAKAEDLAEGNAFLLKTKDDVDQDISKLTDVIDTFKTRVENATADDKEDLTKDENDFETHLDNLKKRIERLTSDGTLTEDEKKAYDDTIEKLKDDLSSIKESIEKLA